MQVCRGNVRAAAVAGKKAKSKGKPAPTSTKPLQLEGVAIKSTLTSSGLRHIKIEAKVHEGLAAGGGSPHVAAALAIGLGPKSKNVPHPDPVSIVLPLMGRSLDAVIAEPASLTDALRWRITAGLIAGALDIARITHSCHADIKPANVMFAVDDTENAHPFLIDLGEARTIGTESMMTFGTPRYNAPELLAFPAGGVRVSSQLDVWSISVVLADLVATIPAVRAELPCGFGGDRDESDMRAAAASGSLFRRELLALRACVKAGALAPRFVEVLERGLQCDPRLRASLEELRDLVALGLEAATAEKTAAAEADVTSEEAPDPCEESAAAEDATAVIAAVVVEPPAAAASEQVEFAEVTATDDNGMKTAELPVGCAEEVYSAPVEEAAAGGAVVPAEVPADAEGDPHPAAEKAHNAEEALSTKRAPVAEELTVLSAEEALCADRAAAAESDGSPEDVPRTCTEPVAPVGDVATASNATTEDLPSSDALSTHAADDIKARASVSAQLVVAEKPRQATDAVQTPSFEKDGTAGTSGPRQKTPSHPEASMTPTLEGVVAAAAMMPTAEEVAVPVESSGTCNTDEGTGNLEMPAVSAAIGECKATHAEEQFAPAGDAGDAASTIVEGNTRGSVENEIPGVNVKAIAVVRAPSESCHMMRTCDCDCIPMHTHLALLYVSMLNVEMRLTPSSAGAGRGRIRSFWRHRPTGLWRQPQPQDVQPPGLVVHVLLACLVTIAHRRHPPCRSTP